MALNFVREKLNTCLNSINNKENNVDVLKTRINFIPDQYLVDNFRQTIFTFQEITKISRAMMFKYYMSIIEEYISSIIENGQLNVNKYKSTLLLFTMINYSFTNIDTAEEFIPNEKKMVLIEIWLQINEDNFGVNFNYIRNCYSSMLLSVSKCSPTFFDGLTQSLQSCFMNKVSPREFKTKIEPWIFLTNDIPRLSSFLKVMTTNLTLVAPAYYLVILETITDIVMNVIHSSNESYKKYLDDNSTSIIAKQVSDMIEIWNVKPLSKAWITQFSLLLVQTNQLAMQTRNINLPFLKTISEMKEIKNSTDIDALAAVLNGFAAISRCGPQPTLVLFMKKFIDLPINFLKVVFKNPRDVQQWRRFSMMVDFPISLLFINVDLFNANYAERMLVTKDVELWDLFANICQRVCKFTSEQPYSFKSELSALVPLLIRNIDLLIENLEQYKNSMETIIDGCASNPLFCRMTFVNHPVVYATFMKLMKKGEVKGFDRLNLALFDKTYVDDIQGPNFWKMLTTLLNTYISLGHTIDFLGSPQFTRVPILIEHAMMYIDAVIKNSEKDALPSTEKWEKILIRFEELILLLLTRTGDETRKSTLIVLNTYLYFITLRPVNQSNMITDQLRELYDTEPTKIHEKFAELLRNQKIPDLIQKVNNYYNNLFISVSADFIPNIPTGSVLPEVIREKSKEEKEGIWTSTLSLTTALLREIPEERYQLFKCLLSCGTSLGSTAADTIAHSLPIMFASDMFNKLKEWLDAEVSNRPLTEIKKLTRFLIINTIKYINKFCDREDADENTYNEESISYIFFYIAHFANVFPNKTVRERFCTMAIDLISVITKFNKKLLPMHRFIVAKNMLQWIPADKINDQRFQITCLNAIESILNGLSFLDTTDPVGDKAKAAENFTLFFTFIKQGANNNMQSTKDEMLNVLKAIMRENFFIGMNSCIAMGYDDDPKVRTAFLKGLSTFFSKEVYQLIVTKDVNDDIIDILMSGNFLLVKMLVQKMPYNKTDEFGKQLIQAAAYKSREFDFFQSMIELELATQTVSNNIEEINRTKLFRGNGTPSKVFSAYAHMVGHEWLCECITPIINKVTDMVNQGSRFQIDPSRLEEGENISKNRENFRIIFLEATETFASKIGELPTGLVKAAQMLYKSVVNQSQKVATQSIASFIFLRFVCPTIPEPTKVGYTDNIDENVRVCLIHLSTLLMIAAVHPKADSNRSYYAVFNDLVGIAYQKFQTVYINIANSRITDVPLVTTIDPMSVTSSIHALLFPMLSVIENEAKDPRYEEISGDAAMFIEKLKKMGPLVVQKEEEIIKAESFASLDKLMNADFNEALFSTLQSVFYHVNQKSRNGRDLFYLNLSAYVKKYPAVYIAKHVFTLLKGYENTKFDVVADCGDFNINLLPSVKEIKDIAPIVPNYLLKNVAQIYVIRLQSNLIKFIQETQILNSLPQPKFLMSMDDFREDVCKHSGFLTETAIESLSRADSVHSATVNKKEAKVNIMQRSIQIRKEFNLGFDFLTNDVIRLIDINYDICPVEKGDNIEFTLTDSKSNEYKFVIGKDANLPSVITEIKKRNLLIKTTRNLIYIEKSSLHMLLINVALLNLVTDQGNYNVRRAALELIKKTEESTDMKYNIDPLSFLDNAYVGTVYDIANKISDDIAINNPQDVHSFIKEFVKTITYLNQYDLSVVTSFFAPWMIHCGDEAIKNKTTLEAIAQISAAIPAGETMQFTERIWSSIEDDSLCHSLLNKSSEFGNSSFVSLFLPLSYKITGLSKILVDYLNQESNASLFIQAAKIIPELIVADTFDTAEVPVLLHAFFKSLLKETPISLIPIFKMLYSKYVGNADDINEKNIHRLPKEEPKDYREYSHSILAFAYKINDILDFIPEAREPFVYLFIDDIGNGDENTMLGSFIVIATIGTKENEEMKNSIFAQLLNGNDKYVSYISTAISSMDLDELNAMSTLCVGIFDLCLTHQKAVIDMILASLRRISQVIDLTDFTLNDFVNKEVVDDIANILGVPFKEDPIYSIIAIAFEFQMCDEIFDLLKELECKHDLVEAVKFDENAIESLKDSKYIQEICILTVYYFVKDSDDSKIIKQLTTLINKFPEIFAVFPTEKITKAALTSKSEGITELLLSFAKSQKVSHENVELKPHFSTFLTDVAPKPISSEHLQSIVEGLFGKFVYCE